MTRPLQRIILVVAICLGGWLVLGTELVAGERVLVGYRIHFTHMFILDDKEGGDGTWQLQVRFFPIGWDTGTTYRSIRPRQLPGPQMLIFKTDAGTYRTIFIHKVMQVPVDVYWLEFLVREYDGGIGAGFEEVGKRAVSLYRPRVFWETGNQIQERTDVENNEGQVAIFWSAYPVFVDAGANNPDIIPGVSVPPSGQRSSQSSTGPSASPPPQPQSSPSMNSQQAGYVPPPQLPRLLPNPLPQAAPQLPRLLPNPLSPALYWPPPRGPLPPFGLLPAPQPAPPVLPLAPQPAPPPGGPYRYTILP